MEAEIDSLQHPDFIWTWKETARGGRQSVWLPYLQSIEKKPRSTNKWVMTWNGGQMDADLSKIDFIMLYGGVGTLPVEFLDALNQERICLSVHRRNMPRPYLFIPSSGADADDILTAQLAARSNEKTSAYVARSLIREKFASTESVCPVPSAEYRRLAAVRNVDAARNIEAHHAARYWPAYYRTVMENGDSLPNRRDHPHPINTALDACSFFLHGVVLRWVLFHKLSPFHGFLHRPTGYPSLVYDLLEPHRWWIDSSVRGAAEKVGFHDEQKLTAVSIEALKSMMEESVYVPATRQTVRRKSLLHGSVLALRAWLLGKQDRFVLPVEGERKGGRPPKVGFAMPGYRK